MGQYIQDGERTLFETVISFAKPPPKLSSATIRQTSGLNFLEGKRIGVYQPHGRAGRSAGHVDGGVPNIRIEIPDFSEA